jgi:hypothetical protein
MKGNEVPKEVVLPTMAITAENAPADPEGQRLLMRTPLDRLGSEPMLSSGPLSGILRRRPEPAPSALEQAEQAAAHRLIRNCRTPLR